MRTEAAEGFDPYDLLPDPKEGRKARMEASALRVSPFSVLRDDLYERSPASRERVAGARRRLEEIVEDADSYPIRWKTLGEFEARLIKDPDFAVLYADLEDPPELECPCECHGCDCCNEAQGA